MAKSGSSGNYCEENVVIHEQEEEEFREDDSEKPTS